MPVQEEKDSFGDAIQKQLNRVLASQFFKASPRHQLLLRTIVNETLAGRTEALKEVVLGKDVLGRPDYDPKRHTLVRVEVNAVRRKLAEYYTKTRAEDRIKIDIPLGHYIAVFSPLPATSAESRQPRAWYMVSVCALAVLSVLVGLWGTRRSSYTDPGVPVQVTFDTGWTSLPAVSRGGSVLVYSSDRGTRGNANVWIQRFGQAPRELTDDPAHHISPDISPDGKQVVFRSWRGEGGIWSVSADGGEAKLLAEGGYAPRFSPDGKRVAFGAAGVDEISHIFAVPAEGGLPERLDYGTVEAECPVWSPDGEAIVFVARSAKTGEHDLWIAKTRAARAELSRSAGIQAELRMQKLPTISSNIDCPQDWIEDRLLFVTHQHDTSFLFQVALGASRTLSRIQAVPSAVGVEGARAVRDAHGRWCILFAAERRQTNIWGYKLTGSTAAEQLTHDNSLTPGYDGTWPALSADGKVLAFITQRSGAPDICLKDLRTGTEQLLAASPSAQSPLFLDNNGNRIVFARDQHSTTSVILRTMADKTEHILSTNCPMVQDWSQNGESLLCAEGTSLYELRIGQPGRTPLLHLSHPPLHARFSPDARWVSFATETGQGHTGGFLAPLDGSNTRIQICEEEYGLSLQWAPNGNAVYYWSTRDGFRCLYMQPLQTGTKLPRGEPIAILHRHTLQHYPWSGGTLSVSSGLLAMTLKDEFANIWKADLPPLTR